MHIKKISLCLGVIGLLLGSCADEDLGPVLTFDTAGKGAYVRLVEETDKLINLFDIAGSQYVYSVEFVDLTQGDEVSEYVLELNYTDSDPSDGDNSQDGIPFRTYAASDFTQLSSGFKGLENISITANEAISAAGLTPDEVNPGDQFEFVGTLILNDGSTFGASNSSAAVRGSAFQGHFNFTLPAGCPSDLTGTYSVTTTDIWCGGSTTTDVTIEDLGGGVYQFDDWSFGSYGVCYGGGSAGGDLTFTDVCAVVSFTGFTDSFGDTWTYTSSVDGNEWTIEWVNTYGEAATSVITNPDGWPFTLAD